MALLAKVRPWLVREVPVEVEGIRLIGDLGASGTYASILPETAIPAIVENVRIVTIDKMPPRRLALIRARDIQLSLADQAVRERIERSVAARLSARVEAPQPVPSRRKRG